jgi:hypothetical protein
MQPLKSFYFDVTLQRLYRLERHFPVSFASGDARAILD